MNETIAWYVENRHEATKKWKQETGKKVYGYFCCVTPEEILAAADILPVRITGTGEPLKNVDLHVPPNSCPFARSCLDAGMLGIYDYLDGVVVPTTCDIISTMEYFWKTLIPRPNKPSIIGGRDLTPFVHSIAYPEKVTGRQVMPYYVDVLRLFKQELERTLRRIITDEDLARVIAVYNEDKAQMKRLYEMRKSDPPAVSGYEAWQITYSSVLMPKDQHAALAKGYLDDLEASGRKAEPGVRLYVSGSAMDSVGSHIYKVIEESGGQVVSDDLCMGTRFFWNPLDTAMPPLEAVARRSLGTACPRSTSTTPIPENRWSHVLDTAKDYDIEGAIFYTLKCCDARSIENPHLGAQIQKEFGVPVLFLEGDYTTEGIEQMRGRIEAFIEMIEG